MRNSILLFVLAAIAVAAPVTTFVYMRQVHERDVDGISRLRDDLDSARTDLAAAATAADSARLLDGVRTREYYVNRRQFHVPLRQERLVRWWRPIGFPTISVATGLMLLVVGLVSLKRAKSRAG